MLGFGYEDFMKLLRQEQGEAASAQPAQFTIDQTEMNGTVENGRANLDIKLQATTRQTGSIRVPIGLSQAIVREDLKYQGDGEAFLDYDAKKNEYVVWIDGKKGQKHDLSLSVAIPTATIGLDTRLRFDAPRSTRSRMTLLIPETDLDIHAPIESRLSVIKGKGPEEKETRLTVDSVRGDFQLLWHKPPTGASEARTVMEASGEIIVSVGSLEITSEALLNVQGRGMPLDRFRVRLPKGTETYQVSDGNYQVTEVEISNSKKKSEEKPETKQATEKEETAPAEDSPEDATENAANGEKKFEELSPQTLPARIIEVRLSEPTLEPVLLHLTTTRPLDHVASPDWIEPAGFEVIDAVRQWGHVATVVGPDHFVSWLPERGIRRVDTLPSTMNVKKPAAVFEYYSAPFLLKSRIAPRRTRVSVEPKHVVHIGADQLEINSEFNYMIRGKSVLSLELNLGNWELDDIGPETLVDSDGIEIAPSGLVTIPLLRPTIGHAQLTLKAHRAAPQRETNLEIAFPRPRVDSPGPAEVAILPDDNVKLVPDATASTGLSRLQAAPSIPLPKRQQSPLFYRGDAGQATFSAKRSIHERQVSVAIRTMVTFEMLTANVEQSFAYQIDHEPSSQVVLDVPELLVQSSNLEFLIDGVPVVPRVLNESVIKQPEPPLSQTKKTPGSAASTSNDTATSTISDDDSELDVMLLEDVTVNTNATESDKENVPVPVEKTTDKTSTDTETKPEVKSAEQTPKKESSTSKPQTPSPEKADDSTAFKTVPVVLTLKPAKIGRCVVTVRYTLPRRVLMPNAPIKRQIPLAIPAVERILHHDLSIVSPLGLTADVLEDQVVEIPFKNEESHSITNGNGLASNGVTGISVSANGDKPTLEPIVDTIITESDLTTGEQQKFNVTGRLGMIAVMVSIEKRHEAPATTIHRAFFQTWVTDVEYQNRALFQFQTRQKQLQLTLPTETVDKRVRLYLNGKSLLFEPLGEHRFLISFPGTMIGIQQLELRWSSRPSDESRTILSLGMPQLGEDAWIQRWYWQLLLPTGEHLLGTPRQVLSESVWQWSGGVFRREPTMQTAELENWVGAPISTTEIPAANLYLFSSFGQPETIQFRVANRSLIVLSASGLVLVAGFLLIYVPVTRHPASLLVLGVVLGSVGVIYPEPMLLGLQASSVGVILVGLTALLKRRVSRPQLPKPIPIADSGGSSILDRDSTQRQIILPPVASHPPTHQHQGSTETTLRPPQ